MSSAFDATAGVGACIRALLPIWAVAFMTCVAAIGEALALHAMPASLNILPLYFVLVAFFPLIYACIGNLPWPPSLSPRRHGSLLASVIVL
jgi:OpgC protein